MEIQIDNLEALPAAARTFKELLKEHKIFAFKAEMGTGKTTFISALLKEIGVNDPAGSPTYSLVNEYETDMGQVFHFDLYRLESEEEAFDIGLEEMLYGSGICLIEWPEKIENLLPEETIWSYIRRNDDNSRTITIKL